MGTRAYIRDAADDVRRATVRCRTAAKYTTDTPTRLALGQAVLSLKQAASELVAAADNAKKAASA